MGRINENHPSNPNNRSVPAIPRPKAAAPAAAAKPATNGNHEVGEFTVVQVSLTSGESS